nr:HNH endonuclease [uncultured Sphingobacterium sp.]
MKCYLTGVDITQENTSIEHILPNALGGKLKSKKVLCSDANLQLSKLIDTKFNKFFEGFYKRLPIKKDRHTNIGLKGTYSKDKREIILKDNQVFPIKPFLSPEGIVYAKNSKEGNNYKRFLNIINQEEIPVITDLAGTIEFPFSLDNQEIFNKGFAKIAAGFASLRGIHRSYLKRIIDLDKKVFRDDLIIFPYFPILNNSIFEFNAYKSKCYPIHSISLKGDKEFKTLYCYVELFSTFQYIVILDDDYEGENLYYSYLYDLMKGKEISLNEYIESIDDIPLQLKSIFQKHKNFDMKNLKEISDIVDLDFASLQRYTMRKFQHLEKFITIQSLIEKMNK